MATKNQTGSPTKNETAQKVKFFPVTVLKHGILYQDGRMLYTSKQGYWLYVSEDGETALMYTNLAELIKDLYKKGNDTDYVITGWDMYPARFEYLIDSGYNYYNERFDD